MLLVPAKPLPLGGEGALRVLLAFVGAAGGGVMQLVELSPQLTRGRLGASPLLAALAVAIAARLIALSSARSSSRMDSACTSPNP